MNSHQFIDIAEHYDELMGGVPYKLWVKYIMDILKRIHYNPHTVLDVACGTGTVSKIMHDLGYDVVGFDLSADMIEIAKKKHPGIEFDSQDIAQLDLAGRKFDLAVSLFDSLNYVTDDNQLAEGIKKVSAHLIDNGIFIFDVNTIYALSNHFFDQANLGSSRYPKYIWTSTWDHSTRICTVNMIFTVLEEPGERQFKEVHVQKGYTLEELSAMLIEAGFEIVDIWHAYKFKKPTRRSDRVFFVARKLKKDEK